MLPVSYEMHNGRDWHYQLLAAVAFPKVQLDIADDHPDWIRAGRYFVSRT